MLLLAEDTPPCMIARGDECEPTHQLVLQNHEIPKPNHFERLSAHHSHLDSEFILSHIPAHRTHGYH